MKLPSISPSNGSEQQEKILQQAQDVFGFTPNLIQKMANAPVVAEAYLTLSGLFEKSTFSPLEQQLILLTVSRMHKCEYCVAAHSALAKMQSLPSTVIDAIRNYEELTDPKLAALQKMTENMVLTRGNPDQIVIDEFLQEGYRPEQLLEMILGIALKTLSNYTNHIADTQLDSVLISERWSARL